MTDSRTTAFEFIDRQQVGAVLRLLHDRPAARNAESQGLLDELDQALQSAEQDTSVRVVIIGGHGEHFSAGHDLKEAQTRRAGFTVEERFAYESVRYFEYCQRIWDFPKPTIAEVQGACVAGGFMVANACDLVIAAEDAFFSDPVCHTLATASVEFLIHPWVMGLRQAKHFLFTGGRATAQEALAMGMVNRVVPRPDLEAESMRLAERIAGAPPFALRLLKRSLNRTYDVQGMRTALQAHFDTHQLSHVSEEFRRTREAGLASAIARGKESG